MDDDLARILEAHVRFEVGRWQGDALANTVEQEVAAGFDALKTLPLSVLAPRERVQSWIRRVVTGEPLTDELLGEIEAAVRAAHESLLDETGPLSQVVPPEQYAQIMSSIAGLRQVRHEVVSQVTASSVYSQLISHVLYHGLKNYVLTENVLVRKLPGASSLLRMGQNAMRSASPGLEANIDRRLVAFVATNVAETILDSQEFLSEMLDDGMLHTVTDEVWTVNGPRSLADLAGTVDESSIVDLLATARDVWLTARSTPVATRLIDRVVEQFYLAHGDEPVADLLTGLGISRARVSAELGAAGAVVAAATRDGGQLETYVRRRLEDFYSTYSASSTSSASSADCPTGSASSPGSNSAKPKQGRKPKPVAGPGAGSGGGPGAGSGGGPGGGSGGRRVGVPRHPSPRTRPRDDKGSSR